MLANRRMCRVHQDLKQRFLAAYAEIRTIAGAARRARIHRATVYRWRADPAFVTAMDAAWEAGCQRWRREVYAPQEAARQAARERRNAELRRLRQAQAAHMRTQKVTRRP